MQALFNTHAQTEIRYQFVCSVHTKRLNKYKNADVEAVQDIGPEESG